MTVLGDVWVFAHGSVMFAPGFAWSERRWARVDGLERRFGHPSIRNWGTPEAPAPTSCLVTGEWVDGVAFRLADPASVDALREREAGDPVVVGVRTARGPLEARAWMMDASWADRTPSQLVAAALANVDAGGGPSGDAIAYAHGVARCLSGGPGPDRATRAYLSCLGDPHATG